MLKGLFKYTSAPESIPLTRSICIPLAVSISSGMWLILKSFFMLLHISNPSIIGIITSDMTKSGMNLIAI